MSLGVRANAKTKVPACERAEIDDRYRREAVAAVRSIGGLLSDPTPAAYPLRREALKMPQSGHSVGRDDHVRCIIGERAYCTSRSGGLAIRT